MKGDIAEMRNTSYDHAGYLADLAMYARFMAEDNSSQMTRLKRNLTRALKQDVTPKQRQYLMLYYGQGMNLSQISEKLGVNKSTVSRTMKRGRQRLYRCLRYGAAALLNDTEDS